MHEVRALDAIMWPVDPNTLTSYFGIIKDGGTMLLLLVAVVGGYKGWFVWRWQYDAMKSTADLALAQMKQERDEWKAIAIRGLAVAEKVTG